MAMQHEENQGTMRPLLCWVACAPDGSPLQPLQVSGLVNKEDQPQEWLQWAKDYSDSSGAASHTATREALSWARSCPQTPEGLHEEEADPPSVVTKLEQTMKTEITTEGGALGELTDVGGAAAGVVEYYKDVKKPSDAGSMTTTPTCSTGENA